MKNKLSLLIVILLLLLTISNLLFSQSVIKKENDTKEKKPKNKQEMQLKNSIEERFKKHQQLIEQMMKDAFSGESFGESSQEMQNLMKGFMSEPFFSDLDSDLDDSMTDDSLIQKFRQHLLNQRGGIGNGFNDINNLSELKWEDKKDERVLSFSVKNVNENSFKIEIKDQSISIKGDIEKIIENKNQNGVQKTISKSSFNQIISVPDDVDAENAQIEKNGDKIVIRFKKVKNGSKLKPIHKIDNDPNVI